MRFNLSKFKDIFPIAGALLAMSVGFTATAALAEPTLEVSRYIIEGGNPISEAETAAILAPHTGGKKTLSQIEDAAKALEKVLRDRGLVFYRVYVPSQKPQSGEIRLQLTRFTIGTVKVSGNEHFSDDNIRRSVPALKEGESPDIRILSRQVTTANASPAKQIAVKFREGERPNTIDTVVRVQDMNPLAFYVGYTANRSVAPSNEGDSLYRMTFTAQHSNLFDRDQVGTLTYSTDPGNVSKVTLLGAYYQAPLYGTSISVSGYFTHTDVKTGRIQQGNGFFDVSGSGDFYGVKVTRAIASTENFHQSISLALDHRYFENSTEFNGIQIQPNVGSLPLTISYAFQEEKPWGGYSGGLEYANNVAWGAANSHDAHFLNGGELHWSAWRYHAETFWTPKSWVLSAKLRGQATSDKLIAGEQFGMGGANSVRGFSDREVAGDHGYLINLEAVAPQIFIENLKPVLFLEGGETYSKVQDHSEGILSVGGGLRWSYKQLDTSLDIAHVLDENGQNPEGIDTRLHFSAIYRF